MTFEDALRELGLDSSADAATARRAYLKLIKARKPESDPEGFKRARESYERVTAQLSAGTHLFAVPVPAPPPAAPEPGTPEGAAVGASPAWVSLTEADFRAEFAALPPGCSVEAPISIARRAVQTLPGNLQATLWLVQTLVVADRRDEAIRALRQAAESDQDALAELALRFPAALIDAELDRLGGFAPVQLLWQVVDNLHSLDLGDRAARTALLAFDAHKRQPEVPPPPPDWLGMLVLKLHEAGAPAAARKVCERYERWLNDEDLLDAFVRDGIGRVWPLVLDLGRLPDDLPRLARSPLARSIYEGPEGLAHAFEQLKIFDAAAALATHQAILARAPKLASAIAPFLGLLVQPAPEPSSAKPSAVLTNLKAAAVIASISVGLVLSINHGGPRAGRAGHPTAQPWATRGSQARAVVLATCEARPDVGEQLCNSAARVVDGLAKPGCGDFREHLAALQGWMEALPEPTTQEGYDFARHAGGMYLRLRELGQSCRGEAPNG